MAGKPLHSTYGERDEISHEIVITNTPGICLAYENGPRRYFPARQAKEIDVTTFSKLRFDLYSLRSATKTQQVFFTAFERSIWTMKIYALSTVATERPTFVPVR